MPFDLSGHSLLSPAAAAAPDSLEDQTRLAALTLGLKGMETVLAGDDLADAEAALARQVNLQVALAGADGKYIETKGDQSITYRNGLMIDSLALLAANRLLGIGQHLGSTATENRFVY
jgi:hypothetical protein